MRFLLDTNIFIHLEDSSKVLDSSFSDFVKLAHQHSHQLLVHPASKDDINRDSNLDRKEISLSRIDKYFCLDSPPQPTESELEQLGLTQYKDNDRVDNLLIYALHRDAVHVLVTEDRGIHKKALSLGLTDRVHFIQQATGLLKKLHAEAFVNLPSIRDVATYDLDLEAPIFDSLRVDYKGFNEWFRTKCCSEGRRAWIYEGNKRTPQAICIYKVEITPIISDDNKALPGKVLKLCTFKVGEEVRGRKIGELFLKAAFQYATKNSIEHIYLTMWPDKQPFLQDMLVEYGFNHLFNYHGEMVLVKKHPIDAPVDPISPLEYHIRYFPHYIHNESVKKYIIPIQPRFHEMLFPEIQKQYRLFSHSFVGNAIKQAYLCNARIKSPNKGDIIMFYRSQDWQMVTSLGVIESVHNLTDIDKIVPLVSKRTVYSLDDITKMAEKETKVILFRLAYHFDRPVSFKWLMENGVINGSIQTISRISDESFERVMGQ